MLLFSLFLILVCVSIPFMVSLFRALALDPHTHRSTHSQSYVEEGEAFRDAARCKARFPHVHVMIQVSPSPVSGKGEHARWCRYV